MTKESMEQISEMLRKKTTRIHELETANRRLVRDLFEAHEAIRKLTADRASNPIESFMDWDLNKLRERWKEAK